MYNAGRIVAQRLLERYKDDQMTLYYLKELINSLRNGEAVSNSAVSKLFFDELIKELSKKE